MAKNLVSIGQAVAEKNYKSSVWTNEPKHNAISFGEGKYHVMFDDKSAEGQKSTKV